jgi:hypothetical protein
MKKNISLIDLKEWTQRGEWLQFKILLHHFFMRLFNLELVCGSSDARSTVVQWLAFLAVPGQFLPLLLLVFSTRIMLTMPLLERTAIILSFQYYYLGFSMVVTGLVTLLNWDSLFPDSRDYAALAPLPVKPRTFFLAKVAALLGFNLAFTVAMNFWNAILYPYVASCSFGNTTSGTRLMAVHAFCILAGNGLVVAALLCLQGLLLNLVPSRWYASISLFAQFLVYLFLISCLLMLPGIYYSLLDFLSGRSRGIQYFPATWILALYEGLMNRSLPPLLPLANWALWSLAGSLAGAAGLYGLCYRRALNNLPASRVVQVRPPGVFWSNFWDFSARKIFRSPQDRALFEFVGKTLSRSRLHQIYFMGFIGAGLAFVIREIAGIVSSQGWEGLMQSTLTLQAIPLGFTFFVLIGIRLIYTVPAEISANWIFQISDGAKFPESLCALRRAMLIQVLLPVQMVFFLMSCIFQGWSIAFPTLVFGLLLSLLWLEGLFLRWNRVPFACTYQPGKAKIQILWPLYWGLFYFYSSVMASLESCLLQNSAAFLTVCGLMLMGTWGIRKYARSRVPAFHSPAYDAEPNPTFQLLNLEY